MSDGRQASVPPSLDGFEPIELVGSGGYADVFRFRQRMPERDVAVKVLVGDVVAAAAFTTEANLMAQVSAHPYIVTIFEAAVARDGRPYLVMEFYPGANYLDRSRTERFAVADALRLGIQVAGAVETAHRSGILHRDIKPANILTSEYGRPGLTDFGIATGAGRGDEADGLSIPWSPPEAFGAAALDARADVYSLAATVYHMLAGRSPFHLPAGRNASLDLMARIERERLASLGRSDVPMSVERLLGQAMSKDPTHRPASAAEFARSLQAIENELRLSPTPLELPDTGRAARSRVDMAEDDATRVRGVVEVDAQHEPSTIGVVPTGGLTDHTLTRRAERARAGILAEPDVAATISRPAPDAAPTTLEHDGSPASRTGLVIGASAVAVVLLAIIGFWFFGGSSGDSASTTTVFEIVGADDVVLLASVDDLEGVTADGIVSFTWSSPDGAESGDLYVFNRTFNGGELVTGRTEETSVSIANAPAGQEVCLEVVVRRAGTGDSGAREACVDS